MEKVFTLLWVLIAIGAFVVRMVKKMRDTTTREAQERPNRPAMPSLPTASFEELLRQMQSRNATSSPSATPAPTAARPAKPAPKTTSRTPAGRPVPLATAQPTRSQERITIRPKSQERPALVPVYAQALPRASSGAPMEDYWQQRTRQQAQKPPVSAPTNAVVRQLLTQPDSVRAAFVLSEILQRKHF